MKTASLKISLLNLLTIFSFAAYAQNSTIDSLRQVLETQKEDSNKVNTLIGITKYLMVNKDYENALKYAENTLLLANKINFRRGSGTAHEYLGWYYTEQHNYTEALKNYLLSLKIREDISDKVGIAKSEYWIGNTYSSLDNFPLSLKYFYLALKEYEILEDKKTSATILQFIGATYSDMGNNSEALTNLFASVKIKEEIKDTLGIAQSCNSIGTIYSRESKYDKALVQFTKALIIYQQFGNQSPDWGIPWSYACIADIYYQQSESAYDLGDKVKSKNKLDTALKTFLKVVDAWQKIGRQDGVASIYLRIGNLMREAHIINSSSEKEKNTLEAKSYFEKALSLSITIQSKMYIRNSYLDLAFLEEDAGNYKQAYEYYKMYIMYRDSMQDEEHTRELSDIKTQYEVSKKRRRDQITLHRK